METAKRDWKLFRERLPGWQEAYMDKLNKEYIELLSGEGNPSDKFWELEKRIKRDRKHKGVIMEMQKSNLDMDLVVLIKEGAISFDDSDGFSEELKERVGYLIDHFGRRA